MSSDILVAILLPLSVLALGMHLFGKPAISFTELIKGPARRHGYFSVERATSSYESYLHVSLDELATMRKSYNKLSRPHKHLGYALGYPAKLDRLEECLRTNGALTAAIACSAQDQFPALQRGRATARADMDGDVARVREALRHFVRDWSAEGQPEREHIFKPILDVLAQVPAEERSRMKVLVPGSGLGRLAWEISELGASRPCYQHPRARRAQRAL